MIKHILVPLDGSHLAEAALPAAAALAHLLKASVMFLHVIEQDAPTTVHRDRHLTNAAKAQAYLEDVTRRFKIRSEMHIHTAPIADLARSIVDHAADEPRHDLIILTSQGNGGMHDLFFGNIAQQVAAQSQIPVLLLKPTRSDNPFHLEHILLPLDNESIHDTVLPLAEELARACHAQLDLLCVIPTPGTDSGAHAAAETMLPVTAAAYLDIAEEIAREHFQDHLEQFQKADIAASAEIARGDPGKVIVKTAKRISADLILFGTHGRTGLDAFWNRSIASSVTRRTDIPLLLVPL